METILRLRRHYYLTRVSHFLIAIALMAGLAGCGSRPAVNAIEIRDWYDLSAIGNNMSANYVLENDLDATTDGWEELASPTANEGKGWKPIAAIDKPPELAYFMGVFDGQGHEIKDLFINRPDGYQVGLFSYSHLWGVIRNIGVVNANVTGGERVGGLVGQVAMVTVSNCYFTGTVTGDEDVGGLVGGMWIGGIVSNSYAAGAVTGLNSTGGLIGFSDNGCTVSHSYFTGSVTGYGAVGGLVGSNFGTVSDSYSTGNVTGELHVGGLAGSNNYTVSNCYSTGRVIGGDQTGGLVGTHQGGIINNSYSTGNVTGDYFVGGLVGANVYESEATVVSASFWDTETSGQASSDGGTGKNTTEMQDIVTFLDAWWSIIGVGNSDQRNPAYTWNIVDMVTYPFLSW